MKRFKKEDNGEHSSGRKWKCLKVLKNQAQEFCRETGLHGYKYIVQNERSKIERIIWAIAVVASLCCAVVMMRFAWNYYASHPILTVIESTHHGIWNYRFPAVTVCDVNRVSLNLTRELVEKLQIPADVSKEFLVQEMGLLNELLHPGTITYDINKNLSQLQHIFDSNGLSIPTVLSLVVRDCDSMIEVCKWKAQNRDCKALFRKSLSRDGFCCSFNYITVDDIPNLSKLAPQKVTACGHQTGISFLVNFHSDDYHTSMLGSAGVKVMLHDPFDYPDDNAQFKIISFRKFAFLTVKPEETYSTETVRSLSIPTRGCVFDDESDHMQYFGSERNFTPARYSFLNCLTECRATIIKAKCGCVPYYYPQNSTRVCNLNDVKCLDEYRQIHLPLEHACCHVTWSPYPSLTSKNQVIYGKVVRSKHLIAAIYESSWPRTNFSTDKLPSLPVENLVRPCDCIKDCNFYRYNLELSDGYLDNQIFYNGLQYTRYPEKGQTWNNRSVVHVFFGDLVSIQYRRNVHYNWRNLFATFGGLLGLFAGFSLMSVFEIIYFFVIRVITDACRKKETKGIVEMK